MDSPPSPLGFFDQHPFPAATAAAEAALSFNFFVRNSHGGDDTFGPDCSFLSHGEALGFDPVEALFDLPFLPSLPEKDMAWMSSVVLPEDDAGEEEQDEEGGSHSQKAPNCFPNRTVSLSPLHLSLPPSPEVSLWPDSPAPSLAMEDILSYHGQIMAVQDSLGDRLFGHESLVQSSSSVLDNIFPSMDFSSHFPARSSNGNDASFMAREVSACCDQDWFPILSENPSPNPNPNSNLNSNPSCNRSFRSVEGVMIPNPHSGWNPNLRPNPNHNSNPNPNPRTVEGLMIPEPYCDPFPNPNPRSVASVMIPNPNPNPNPRSVDNVMISNPKCVESVMIPKPYCEPFPDPNSRSVASVMIPNPNPNPRSVDNVMIPNPKCVESVMIPKPYCEPFPDPNPRSVASVMIPNPNPNPRSVDSVMIPNPNPNPKCVESVMTPKPNPNPRNLEGLMIPTTNSNANPNPNPNPRSVEAVLISNPNPNHNPNPNPNPRSVEGVLISNHYSNPSPDPRSVEGLLIPNHYSNPNPRSVEGVLIPNPYSNPNPNLRSVESVLIPNPNLPNPNPDPRSVEGVMIHKPYCNPTPRSVERAIIPNPGSFKGVTISNPNNSNRLFFSFPAFPNVDTCMQGSRKLVAGSPYVVSGNEEQERERVVMVGLQNASRTMPASGGVPLGDQKPAVKRGRRQRKVLATSRRVKQPALADLQGLLVGCAEAVARDDAKQARGLLNEIWMHASPLGTAMQRLAHYFALGLLARISGARANDAMAILYSSAGSSRRAEQVEAGAGMILKAYQLFVAVCPFLKLSHFFANQAILNATAGASRLHIVDCNILYGFQWPCFIKALAEREGGPPQLLRITGIDSPRPGFEPTERVDEAGRRLAQYANAYNIPFEYDAIVARWEEVNLEVLNLRPDEVLVVNCIHRLRHVMDETFAQESKQSPRKLFLGKIHSLNPKLFVEGVVSAGYNAPFFISRFREALFHFSSVFDALDNTIRGDLEERLIIEREIMGREIFNIVACEGQERRERPEPYRQWQWRTQGAGFEILPLDPCIKLKVQALVKGFYHKDYGVEEEDGRWLLLGWKGRILNGLSTWQPGPSSS